MSIDTQQEQEAKVRKDLNLHSAPCTAAAGASDVPILKILHILAILLQTLQPLRSLRTFSPCCRGGAIDIKVFQTFSPYFLLRLRV